MAKTRTGKSLIHILETKEQIRETIISDINREVKERQRELERAVLELQDAMRGPN